MNRTLIVLAAVLALSGCATKRCDRVQPYQQTAAGKPLAVPDDLSTPAMRSRAPEVEPNAPTRRPDGRCLEDPPLLDTATPEPDAKDN